MKKTLFFLCLISFSVFSQDRPNILWLTYEDTSPEFIGAYGNADAKTPFMDFMAEEGVRFTGAFSTGSVCSPSRSAIITGVKTFELGTGNHRSNYTIPDYIHGFPKYLRDAGYYTSNNAKTDYNVADEAKMIANAWDESSNKAGWWNKKEGQPFFSVFNSNSCHQSRTMTLPFEQYEEMIWNQLPDSLKTGDNDFEMPPFYRDSPEMRKQMARVYNSLSKTNIEFQEIYMRLVKEGLVDNTIIFSFGDHGEGMPRMKTNGLGLGHRVPFTMWFPEKYKHLSPWGQGGIVTDEMIDFVDLAPTVLALAGVEIPSYMKGRVLLGEHRTAPRDYLYLSSDRSDESYDLTRTVIKGKYAYTRIYMPYIQELRHLMYMDIGEITAQIRNDFKDGKLNDAQELMLIPRPAEYLFDLENDPWELNNLAESKSHRALLQEFRTKLKANILKERDVLFLPEYEIGKISENGNAYEFRLDLDKYPLEQIYELAELAGFRDKATLKKQLNALKAENPFVRYWALMGLKSQDNKTFGKQLLGLLDDIYEPNAILAAAMLYEISPNAEAKAVIQKAINSEYDHISNLAIQQIIYQPNASDFTEMVEVFEAEQKSLKKKERLFNAARSAPMFRYVLSGGVISE
ncbi:sulfatase [uncultured Arcticibacterium sp.]|uniref:sulfatase family protein n=1 Tax=uncultured Arcticibacterium sp. TaxID=2173042 RepID=UPI0030FCBB5B